MSNQISNRVHVNGSILRCSQIDLTKKKITVGGRGAGVEAVEVVRLAEDASLVQSKLFTGAELASAGVAGETRQVVDVFAGPPHPIGGRYRTAAAGALGSKSPKLHPIISQHCKTSTFKKPLTNPIG